MCASYSMMSLWTVSEKLQYNAHFTRREIQPIWPLTCKNTVPRHDGPGGACLGTADRKVTPLRGAGGEASLKHGHALFDVAGALQLCWVRVQLRRGQPAALALAPQHLQSAVESLSNCALQRGPLPYCVQAQLGAAGAQQGEDKRATEWALKYYLDVAWMNIYVPFRDTVVWYSVVCLLNSQVLI